MYVNVHTKNNQHHLSVSVCTSHLSTSAHPHPNPIYTSVEFMDGNTLFLMPSHHLSLHYTTYMQFRATSQQEIRIQPPSLNPPRGRGIVKVVVNTDRILTAGFLCCSSQRNWSRDVPGSNQTRLLSPVSIPLPPAPGPLEGGKMGV